MRRFWWLRSWSPMRSHQLVVHQIDEVGSLAGIDVRRRQAERLGLGAGWPRSP